MLNSDHTLQLHYYQQDDEFRKITPDVKRLFDNEPQTGFQLLAMPRLSDLPPWIKNTIME